MSRDADARTPDRVVVAPDERRAAVLDVIRRARLQFPGVPLAAYNVSGEYAMLKAASERGWIDGDRVTVEILTAIRRAGADFILTYSAKDAARILGGGQAGAASTTPEPPAQ